jgi:glycerol transport system ATP-binding protein
LAGHLRSLKEGKYTFGVRSNHLFVSRKDQEDTEIPAKVELTEINGSETFIHAKFEDFRLVVQEEGVRSVKLGAELKIFVNPSRFFAYDGTGALVAAPASNGF